MKQSLLIVWTASLLLGNVVQIHAGGSSERNRDAVLRRIEALQVQIAALEKIIPHLERTVMDSTETIHHLQRRKLSSSCALQQIGASCVLSTPLQVQGSVNVVGQTVRAGELNVTGALDVKGNLGVNGSLSHKGSLTSVAGNLNVNLEATINDDMAVIGNFDVTNNMIFGGNLDVVGSDSTTTFTNDLHVQTDAIFSNSATMLGNVIVDGPFHGNPPQGNNPTNTNFDLVIQSEFIDIKKKSLWKAPVFVEVNNQFQAMKVNSLIIGAGLCAGSSKCNIQFGS